MDGTHELPLLRVKDILAIILRYVQGDDPRKLYRTMLVCKNFLTVARSVLLWDFQSKLSLRHAITNNHQEMVEYIIQQGNLLWSNELNNDYKLVCNSLASSDNRIIISKVLSIPPLQGKLISSELIFYIMDGEPTSLETFLDMNLLCADETSTKIAEAALLRSINSKQYQHFKLLTKHHPTIATNNAANLMEKVIQSGLLDHYNHLMELFVHRNAITSAIANSALQLCERHDRHGFVFRLVESKRLTRNVPMKLFCGLCTKGDYTSTIELIINANLIDLSVSDGSLESFLKTDNADVFELLWNAKKLTNDPKRNHLLTLICKSGAVNILRRAIKLGFNPRVPDNQPPLETACVYKNMEIAKVLLDEGGVDPADNSGICLIIAIRNDCPELVQLLLSKKTIDINTNTGNENFLDWAIRLATPKTIKVLLSCEGIIVTESHIARAAEWNSPEVVTLLQDHNKNLTGREALRTSSDRGHTHITKEIVKYV